MTSHRFPCDNHVLRVLYVYLHNWVIFYGCTCWYMFQQQHFSGLVFFREKQLIFPGRKICISTKQRSQMFEPYIYIPNVFSWEKKIVIHWIGSRENLQEPLYFAGKTPGYPVGCPFNQSIDPSIVPGWSPPSPISTHLKRRYGSCGTRWPRTEDQEGDPLDGPWIFQPISWLSIQKTTCSQHVF